MIVLPVPGLNAGSVGSGGKTTCPNCVIGARPLWLPKFRPQLFPNAQLIADKFHVLRLITPAIHRRIKEIGLERDALPLYGCSAEIPASSIPRCAGGSAAFSPTSPRCASSEA